MNPVHFHLLLNHLPVMGTAFACVLLGFAMLKEMESFKKLAYVILVFSALATPPVFLSGEGAEEKVEHMQGISESAIHDHEEAGEAALAAMIALGVLSLGQLGLYAFPNLTRLRGKTAFAILIASGLAFAWLAWTANLGGLIRHGEELGTPAPRSQAADLED
jgi:hypothetical protein